MEEKLLLMIMIANALSRLSPSLACHAVRMLRKCVNSDPLAHNLLLPYLESSVENLGQLVVLCSSKHKRSLLRFLCCFCTRSTFEGNASSIKCSFFETAVRATLAVIVED